VEPDDIAYTVLFLASDESKFINGAAIRVDDAKSVIAGVGVTLGLRENWR